MKVKSNGELKELVLKANDSIPAGTIVDFDGDVVPEGYEKVEDNDEVYSTEEQKIGTWIDGKPVYRKVVSGTVNASTASGQFVYPSIFVANNIDNWIKSEAKINFTDLNRKTSLPYTFANGNRLYVNQLTSDGVEFANETTYGGTVTVICEYTKTTD